MLQFVIVLMLKNIMLVLMVFAIQEMVLFLIIRPMTMLIKIEIAKFFYKEYVGDELTNPFRNYTDVKTKYPFQL